MILYIGRDEIEINRIGGIVEVGIHISGGNSHFMTLMKDEVEEILDVLLAAQDEWIDE